MSQVDIPVAYSKAQQIMVDERRKVVCRAVQMLRSIPFSRKTNFANVDTVDETALNQRLIESTGVSLNDLVQHKQSDVWDDQTIPSAFDDVWPDCADDHYDLIFVLTMNDGKRYLINTEGYNYSRYCLQLTGARALDSYIEGETVVDQIEHLV